MEATHRQDRQPGEPPGSHGDPQSMDAAFLSLGLTPRPGLDPRVNHYSCCRAYTASPTSVRSLGKATSGLPLHQPLPVASADQAGETCSPAHSPVPPRDQLAALTPRWRAGCFTCSCVNGFQPVPPGGLGLCLIPASATGPPSHTSGRCPSKELSGVTVGNADLGAGLGHWPGVSPEQVSSDSP